METLPVTAPSRLDASDRQTRRSTQILAAAAAIAPMFGIGIWMWAIRDSPLTVGSLLLSPLLGGGALIFWLLFLHLLVCGDTFESLGLRRGRLGTDLLYGLALGVGFLMLHFSTQDALRHLFPPRPPADEIIELLDGLSRSPLLLAIWLGPVVWIGIAGFEELWRAFVLRRLWRVWSGPRGRWAVILVVSGLVGLAHAYQGPAGVISIGIKSVLMAAFFMKTGRIRALIVAHALYDSIQVVMAVIEIRGMAG